VETLQLGANVLAKSEEADIIQRARQFLTKNDAKKKVKNLPNPFGDGHASAKIIEMVRKFWSAKPQY
jgi:UDP-N-acetylglucosamine 2-epimerase